MSILWVLIEHTFLLDLECQTDARLRYISCPAHPMNVIAGDCFLCQATYLHTPTYPNKDASLPDSSTCSSCSRPHALSGLYFGASTDSVLAQTYGSSKQVHSLLNRTSIRPEKLSVTTGHTESCNMEKLPSLPSTHDNSFLSIPVLASCWHDCQAILCDPVQYNPMPPQQKASLCYCCSGY